MSSVTENSRIIYHDIEGKNKDEEKKAKFNKKAGTYASQFADWSTQFSRAGMEQQRSCPDRIGQNTDRIGQNTDRIGQNTSSYETGRMVSEGNCDVWRGYPAYNCIFSYLQSYLWRFFYQFY